MATIARARAIAACAASRDDRSRRRPVTWRAPISAALLARERTGRGREVNISLFSMGLWMNASDLTVGLMTGRSPQSESRTERVNPLWSSYKCADERWIYFVMIQSDRHWPDFCGALGKSEWLDDPRFKDSNARAQNCATLTTEIDRAVAARTLRRMGRRFSIATTWSGRPCAPTPKCSMIRRPTPSALSPRSITQASPDAAS